MADEYVLRLGRRTAQLVAQLLSAAVIRARLRRRIDAQEEAVVAGLLRPLVDWVDKGPPRAVEVSVEVVRKEDGCSTSESSYGR